MYDDGPQGPTDAGEGHSGDHDNAEQGNGGNSSGSAQSRANNVLNLRWNSCT